MKEGYREKIKNSFDPKEMLKHARIGYNKSKRNPNLGKSQLWCVLLYFPLINK